MLLGKPAEHVYKVDRRHVAAFLEKIRGRVGYELPVSAAYINDGVDADGLHVGEVPVPFFLSPVLVRDVVRNLVQKGSRDAEAVVFRYNEGGF